MRTIDERLSNDLIHRSPFALASTLALTLALTALVGCAPYAADARMGTPRPARGTHCDLTVIDAMDVANLAKYEQVGIVHVSNAEQGKSPLDPEMRALVRPRACALGGEAISVLGSGDARSRNGLRTTAYGGYIVWARKPATPAIPQKF